jgi:hypothetical protein
VLSQSGRYVSFKTVNTWRHKGWKARPAAESRPRRQPSTAEIERLDLYTQVFTGDPTTTVADLTPPLTSDGRRSESLAGHGLHGA